MLATGVDRCGVRSRVTARIRALGEPCMGGIVVDFDPVVKRPSGADKETCDFVRIAPTAWAAIPGAYGFWN